MVAFYIKCKTLYIHIILKTSQLCFINKMNKVILFVRFAIQPNGTVAVLIERLKTSLYNRPVVWV